MSHSSIIDSCKSIFFFRRLEEAKSKMAFQFIDIFRFHSQEKEKNLKKTASTVCIC